LFVLDSADAGTPVEALHMAWDDCPIVQGVSHNNPFSCSTNLGSGSLYCALSVLQPLDQVIGLELVVDVQHSQSTLPDYWRLGPAPDCRHDDLSASVDFTGTNGCVDPAFSGALVQDYVVGSPGGLASQARIKVVVFLPSPETRTFANDTTYHAARLIFSYDHSTNPVTCAGCNTPACLVLNSIWIRRTQGAFGGDVFVGTPGAGNSNWATWQGKSGSDCSMVPVRNLTWGSIKSLYR
jgi:hypothetical protein